MTRRLSAVALCALAGSAVGQTQLRYEARLFNPANNDGWTTSLQAAPGSRIEVRSVVSTPTDALGLSIVIYQPVISSWSAADHLLTNSDLGLSGTQYSPSGIGPNGSILTTPPGYVSDQPGAYGRIGPFAASFTNTSTFLRGHTHVIGGASYLRIAMNHITNWIGTGATSGTASANNFNGGGGVTSAQARIISHDENPAYPPPRLGTTDLVVFKFGFVLSPAADLRSLSVSTPANGIGGQFQGTTIRRGAWWFAAPTEYLGSIFETVTVQDATISVPTPFTLVPALSLIFLCGRRERDLRSTP